MLDRVMMETHRAAVMAVWPTWRWAMGLVKLTIMVPAAFAKMNIRSRTEHAGVLHSGHRL